MRIDILSLFPNYFQGPFDESIIKRAREKGILDIQLINIRDFATGPHRNVDDRVYGGGPGMVMMPGPIAKAIRSVKKTQTKVIYLSPQGAPLTAEKCRELAKCEHIVMLCGHYEGVDERVLEEMVDEEISIGDYVLTNGCLPAIVLVDALSRFVPGVLGHEEAAATDSFEQGILDHPHYTRPEEFEGKWVPEILRSGDHEKIASWRYNQALMKTKKTRSDLYVEYLEELAEENNEELLRRAKRRNKQQISFLKHKKEINRTTLLVSDLKKSIRFYVEELGLELIKHGKSNAVLDLGSSRLCLIQGLLPNKEVTVLEECSIVFEMQAYDWEAFQELAKRHPRRTRKQEHQDQLIHILDPDGYLWCVRYEQID